MFEFIEKTANDIVENIKNDKISMLYDANSYETKAKKNEETAKEKEKQAKEKEKQAKMEEASCPHFKEEENTITDENGETTTEIIQVPDLEADEISRNKAVNLRKEAIVLRAEAVALKADAEVLKALVLILKATSEKMQNQIQNFNNAITETKEVIDNAKNILYEGSNAIAKVISAFNISETNDIKEIFNGISENMVKLSELNLGVDLKKIIEDGKDWLYETSENTKAYLAENTKSVLEDLLEIDAKTILTNIPIVRNVAIFSLGLFGIYTAPNIDEAYIVDNEETRKTKEEAIRLYIEFLDTLNISEERKEVYKENFTREIQNAVILKDDYFEKVMSNGAYTITLANYQGAPGKGQGFIRESAMSHVGILMHEIGGHSTGTMLTGKWAERGMYIYDITNPDNVPKFLGMGQESGMNETTTEYFNRKILKRKNEEIAYNRSVDLLEKIIDSMTKYGICDAEAILYESYVGENKNLFKEQYNKIVGNDVEISYNTLEDVMFRSNECTKWDINEMNRMAEEFDKKCAEYAEKQKETQNVNELIEEN